jgi:hypothetical protein
MVHVGVPEKTGDARMRSATAGEAARARLPVSGGDLIDPSANHSEVHGP